MQKKATGLPHAKERNQNIPNTLYKNKHKIIKDLNVRPDTIKILEETLLHKSW